MAQHDEMRLYRRVKEHIDIKIDIADPEHNIGKFHVGKAANISAAGVLFRYDKPIDIGTHIIVSFLSPNSFEIFKLNAHVVRVEITLDNQYDIGVSFFSMSEDDKKRLNYYLTYH